MWIHRDAILLRVSLRSLRTCAPSTSGFCILSADSKGSEHCSVACRVGWGHGGPTLDLVPSGDEMKVFGWTAWPGVPFTSSNKWWCLDHSSPRTRTSQACHMSPSVPVLQVGVSQQGLLGLAGGENHTPNPKTQRSPNIMSRPD